MSRWGRNLEHFTTKLDVGGMDGYSDVFAELIPEIKFPNLSISSRISTFFDQNWAENEEKWLKC